MTAGLSRYVPFSTSGHVGVDPYLWRSAFNAGISSLEDCRGWDYSRDTLRLAIAEGQRLRMYYYGDFYVLSPVTVVDTDWCVLQYHRPAQGDGIVLAFRRHRSPYASFSCALHQIEPEVEYEVVQSYTYEQAEPVRMKGAELAELALSIQACPGSLLVEYRRLE
jgi:hypothetical protein